MNIVQLNNFIKKIVDCTETVNSFYTDSVYECWNGKEDVQYGSVAFCITDTSMNNNTMSYSAILYYGDRLLEDKSNRDDVWTSANEVIQSIIGTINGLDGNVTVSYPYQIKMFEQKFADYLAGGYAQLTITVEGVGECGELLYGYTEEPEIRLEEVVATYRMNGTYSLRAGRDYDAIEEANITVAVPDPRLEDKIKVYTSNGIYDIVPDSEYDGISSVEITVNVPIQEKSIEITSNGSVTVTPDDGFAGMDSVTIDVEIPLQEKSVSYSESGEYEVTPDNGYNGLTKVNVNVSLEGKQTVPNGFRFTGGDMSLIEWDKYDWSMVYDMHRFFKNCTASDDSWGDRFVAGFNGKILGCNYMFEYWKGSTIPLFDTSDALDMSYMFSANSKITTIPLFDTSNVLDMRAMFQGCTSLITIPLLNTQNVTDMSNMFYNCGSITTIPPLDTSNTLTMYSMFYNCQFLTTIPELDTSKVHNMEGMFQGCTRLTTLPQIDISNITNMYSTFYNCRSLKEIRFKGNPQYLNAINSNAFYNVSATVYYDDRYDYSKIINVLPTNITPIPYNVVEYESSNK